MSELMEAAPVLRVDGVSAGYGAGSRSARVLRDVSLSILPGRTMGVVGESGSGKSTLARVLVGQLAPLTGSVALDGRDLATMSRRGLRAARRQVQLVPQDPFASLDPRMTVGRALAEAIDPGAALRRVDRARITRLLETVALEGDVVDRLPHEFSGGQRQRIVIARALAVEPKVVIADEVTSALDSSVQAEILDLLLDLQRRNDLALVFITHDLSIARYMCDEVSVLYLGRMVEQGDIGLLAEPAHPYTELLRASVPDPSGGMFDDEPPAVVAADPGDPAHPPSGCPFHPRCPHGPRVLPERSVCTDLSPPLVQPDDRRGRVAACHFPLVRTGADD
ncbi:MAG TPA: ABC transporter ATP-binding protein [Pseudonocardiaceae bacterium]|nr:ABC transporter ATP-binding protein [Pseudonocardiaceae bacterium]